MSRPFPEVPVPDIEPVVQRIGDISTVLFGPLSLDILHAEAERAWWPRSMMLRRRARRLAADIDAARARSENRGDHRG